jgi:hypothetical protein
MWSIWNAPSDRDYYAQDGPKEDEPEPDEELKQETEINSEKPTEQGEQYGEWNSAI